MKNPLSFAEQVKKLIEHDIKVPDPDFAESCLRDVNYYRLRGYWLSFEEKGKIKHGTNFEDIWNVYLFDAELRNWLFTLIQPIEIKLKTQLANIMSLSYGPTAYRNECLFKDFNKFTKLNQIIDKEIKRADGSSAVWVKHNLQKYKSLPMWAVVELMTFGNMSSMVGNLDPKATVKGSNRPLTATLSNTFGIQPHYLISWLRHLSYIRNICAHQNRFYDSRTTISPRLFNDEKHFNSKSQFSTFLVLRHIYLRAWPTAWIKALNELKAISAKYKNVSLKPMGFPDNWLEVLSIN